MIQSTIDKVVRTSRDKVIRNFAKLVKSEFQREPSKEVTDTRAIKIISGLIKSESERLKHLSGGDVVGEAKAYITFLQEYLPKQLSEDEVRQWIVANINFDDYKNKMQAMRPIMAHFGTTTNGNVVKKIISEL